MTIEDFRALPNKIFLVRHAESQGNVDPKTYSEVPDYEVPLSAKGWDQACLAGAAIKAHMERDHGPEYKLFFMTSPYCRTRQTFVAMRGAFAEKNVAGVHVSS
jgi:phosphohistidine phosphatase SixA